MGRISYSWYLWHWPVLVLAPYALGHTLSVWEDVALGLLSALPAALSYRFVETPGRTWRWVAVRPARSLLTGTSLSLAGIAVCALAAASLPTVTGHGQAPVAVIRQPAPTAGPAGSSGSSGGPSGTGGGAHQVASTKPKGPSAKKTSASHRPAVSPLVARLDAAQRQVEAAVDRSAPGRVLPANLDPPLADAPTSEAEPFFDGCLVSFLTTTPPPCLFGDTTGTGSIVLYGDSHATMWFPAFDAYANAHHDRLYVWTKAACPPVDLSIFSPDLDRTYTECNDFRSAVLAQIVHLHPSLVVLGIAPNYDSAYQVTQDGPAWLKGLGEVVHSVVAAGSHVLVMGSVPSPDADIPDCVSAHPDKLQACDVPKAETHVGGGGMVGVDSKGQAAEATVVQKAGGTFADVTPWFCAATICPVVVDNLLVYRDNSHVTVPYATYLAPLVGDEIDLALAPAVARAG